MKYLEEIDHTVPGFGELYDELPLWSAPFGLLLLDRVPMKTGLTILDVGAGTGFLTLELAQRCGPTSKVIAVDPWKAGMIRLRKKLEQLNLTNVVLLEQDAGAMDVPDSSVDLIVSNLGLNNFDDPAGVLRACHRVGKPDASLFLTSNVTGHMTELYEVYRETLIELGLTERLGALDAHIAHRGNAESIANLLQSGGFRVVQVTKDSFRMRFADGTSLLRHAFVRLGFVPGWKSVAPADSLQRTFEAFERNLNALASRLGEIPLTIPMVCIEARKENRPQALRR
jgi:arsenite methyltransferase